MLVSVWSTYCPNKGPGLKSTQLSSLSLPPDARGALRGQTPPREQSRTMDRLSNLPDELLLHIVSLLPSTRLQASTNVLSKRWLGLWTRSPNLAFHLHDFSPRPWLDPVHTKSYPLIVDRCLELSSSPTIAALSLDAPPSRDPAVDRWLVFAASRSAVDLSLRFFSRVFSPPPSLFTCRSLAALTLEGCCLTLPPSSVPSKGFPCLKSLTLIGVEVADEVLDGMLSTSPLLETLVVDDCRRLKVVRISPLINPRLENLVVSNPSKDHRLVVHSPHIRTIFYRSYVPSLSMVSSPGLLRACILGGGGSLGFRIRNDWKATFSAVSHAKFLLVDNWVFPYLGRRCEAAMFQNLKELHFRVIPNGTVLSALDSALGECPSLEKLCIEFEGTSEDRMLEELEPMSHPLKMIRFFNVPDDSNYVMSPLSFLLGCADALETLEIHPCQELSVERISKLKESVFRLPRASQLAKVVVRENSTISVDMKQCCMNLWARMR